MKGVDVAQEVSRLIREKGALGRVVHEALVAGEMTYIINELQIYIFTNLQFYSFTDEGIFFVSFFMGKRGERMICTKT